MSKTTTNQGQRSRHLSRRRLRGNLPHLQRTASGEAKISENVDSEKVRESLKLGESLCSLEGVRKAAAWYIDKSENLANRAIELQEKRTWWARETLLAPLFEAQRSIALEVNRVFGFRAAQPLADALVSSARLSPATDALGPVAKTNLRAALLFFK